MYKHFYTLIILGILSMPVCLKAQQVIVTDDASYTAPANGAMLDVKSTTKGFMVPRMTTSQRNTLGGTTPANGVVVYDTDLKSFWYWDSGAWFQLAASGINLNNIKFGDASNYSTFEADGTLLMVGNATVWDDIQIPGFSTKASTNAPTFAMFMGGTFINYFEDVSNNENQVFFTVQLPHTWAGTAIYPHIHFSPETDAGSAVVRWGLEYTWVSYDASTPLVFPSPTIIYVNATVPASSAKKHLLASFGPITPSASQNMISSMLVCRLFRNSSDPADTYIGRAGFLQFDIHIEKNTEGSHTEFTK